MSSYPELDKLHKIRKQSQTIGEFLDWLSEHGYSLAVYHEHSKGCFDDEDECVCGYTEGSLAPMAWDIEKRLAEYFEIDLKKVEAERRLLLEEARVASGKKRKP